MGCCLLGMHSFVSAKPLKYFDLVSFNNIHKFVQNLPKDKRPVVFCDFDGTIYPLFYPQKPDKLIKQKEFILMTSKLHDANIPFVVLSARAYNQFYPTNTENRQLNIVALNGNEMSLNLPNNDKVQNFIEKYENDEDFSVHKKVAGGFIYLQVKPKPDKNFLRCGKMIKSSFEPLGFTVEDKGITVALRFRKLFNKIKENQELGNILTLGEVPSSIFNEIKEFYKSFESENVKPEIKIINSISQEAIELNSEALLEYVIKKFNNIYKYELGYDFTNYKGAYFKLTQKQKRTYEIHLRDFYKSNKGNILKEIFELYNGDNKAYPIFIGDSLGEKDDEPAIKKVEELKGFGIGILCRSEIELNSFRQYGKKSTLPEFSKRLEIETSCGALFESFEQTIPFLGILSDNYVNFLNVYR